MPGRATIKVDGKIYTGVSWSPKKRDAQRYARIMREKGKLARVKAVMDGYTVYIRNG